MAPSISVIIPSALKSAPDGRPWLARALASVEAQTLRPCEIIVGLDPGAEVPPLLINEWRTPRVLKAFGDRKGHQAACNAAARMASGRLLAFLEDDDLHEANHLETLARVMEQTGADFVSSSQAEVNTAGHILLDPEGDLRGRIRVFDFPTASGWLLSKLLWHQLGGFNERLTIHHDNGFVGALNREEASLSVCAHSRRARRAHVVEDGPKDALRTQRLALIARHAQIVTIPQDLPTVRRTIHPESVMGGMGADPARARRSQVEYAWCEVEFGDLANTW